MSFSKVPDGAFTPDEGHGVEARSSPGMGVVSLGYVPGGMGQLRGCSRLSRRQEQRGERKGDEWYPAARESSPCTPHPTRQTGSCGYG